MFNDKQLIKVQRLLNIKQKENANFFIYRLKNWIEKNGYKQGSLVKAIGTILEDIHKKEINEAQEEIKVNIKGITHPVLRKYGQEIINLHKEGLGARRIKQLLLLEHNAKISHQSILNFLKKQNFNKEEEKNA